MQFSWQAPVTGILITWCTLVGNAPTAEHLNVDFPYLQNITGLTKETTWCGGLVVIVLASRPPVRGSNLGTEPPHRVEHDSVVWAKVEQDNVV